MIKLNGKELGINHFPNGEVCINIDQIEESIRKNVSGNITVKLKFESNADLMNLYFLKSHLDTYDLECVNLDVVYMPYSRMDRPNYDFVFTLKHATKLINDLGFDNVCVYDPHSDATMILLDRAYSMSWIEMLACKCMSNIDFDPEKDYLLFPDMGAQKRYSVLDVFKGLKSVVGYKQRNFSTGKIESLKILGEDNLNGGKVVIIDDLCSRGGTFIWSAAELKKIGAGDIHLVVPHCENTVLEGDIPHFGTISSVYTTNSIFSDEHQLNKFDVTKVF